MRQFVLAMTSDATVYVWGENSAGQLGDGTTVDRLTPIAISGAGMAWRVATPALSVASGLYYTDQSVTVTIADPDATLRYTTTGVDPDLAATPRSHPAQRSRVPEPDAESQRLEDRRTDERRRRRAPTN